MAEFEGTVNCSSPHNAVVLGLAPQAFHYDRLDEAFRLLIEQPDAPLIAIHKGKYLRVSGLLMLMIPKGFRFQGVSEGIV